MYIVTQHTSIGPQNYFLMCRSQFRLFSPFGDRAPTATGSVLKSLQTTDGGFVQSQYIQTPMALQPTHLQIVTLHLNEPKAHWCSDVFSQRTKTLCCDTDQWVFFSHPRVRAFHSNVHSERWTVYWDKCRNYFFSPRQWGLKDSWAHSK